VRAIVPATVALIIQIEANHNDQWNNLILGMWKRLWSQEIVKKLPCSVANGPQRIQKEGTAGRLTFLCIGCTSVVQCERTVVLRRSAEMQNFSLAECGKAIRGNLRNVPHLIFFANYPWQKYYYFNTTNIFTLTFQSLSETFIRWSLLNSSSSSCHDSDVEEELNKLLLMKASDETSR